MDPFSTAIVVALALIAGLVIGSYSAIVNRPESLEELRAERDMLNQDWSILNYQKALLAADREEFNRRYGDTLGTKPLNPAPMSINDTPPRTRDVIRQHNEEMARRYAKDREDQMGAFGMNSNQALMAGITGSMHHPSHDTAPEARCAPLTSSTPSSTPSSDSGSGSGSCSSSSSSSDSSSSSSSSD